MQAPLFLLALFALPTASALRVSPLATRRHAVLSGASLVPGLMLSPLAAQADTIDDIAARSNLAAQERMARKKEAEENKGLAEAADGGLNLLLTVGGVVILGGVGAFVASLAGQSSKMTVNNLDNNRFATAKERKEMGLDK